MVFLVEAIFWISVLKTIFTYKINKRAVSHFLPQPNPCCVGLLTTSFLSKSITTSYPFIHYPTIASFGPAGMWRNPVFKTLNLIISFSLPLSAVTAGAE